MEDSAAMIGILIAAAGIVAAEYFEMPVLDGVASIGIGALLGGTAVVLARESKSLLIGETASPEINAAIWRIVDGDPAVEKVRDLSTVHLGPEEIVAILGLDFNDLRTEQIEDAIERIQKRIKAEAPLVVATFIKPPSV
jgi:divalent metal cation (Fe/Co/Zn/Cd) transporter